MDTVPTPTWGTLKPEGSEPPIPPRRRPQMSEAEFREHRGAHIVRLRIAATADFLRRAASPATR